MTSLPFSLASSCPPKKLTTFSSKSLITTSHHNPTKAQEPVTTKIPIGQQKSIHPTNLFIKRREAISVVALSIGLIINIEPLAALCELTVAPSGLAFCDKVVGYGPKAVKGQLIKAHYVGKLENGKVFDSSYNRGSPLSFRVGVGEVIQGWDQGILGTDGVPPMLPGGKRTLKLPPELGYGVRGAGCRGGSCIIPPNAVLLFDVEFIG